MESHDGVNDECGDDGVAGYYGSVPASNVHVVGSSRHLLLDSIDKIKVNNDKRDVFCFCDYGTGDGVASMSLIYACIGKIKQVFGSQQEVHVIYEDQPENEFKQIFISLNEPKSFQVDFPKVYVSTVGRSYFEQCLPSNTIYLGYSVMCMHWLSTKPCNITDGVLANQTSIESERKSFEEQAAKDWETILLNRAAEMKNGARFVSVQICKDNEGSFTGNTVHEEGDLYQCMKTCLEKMVESGRITHDEYHNTCLVLYYRTLKEYAAPFEDENSPVRKAGLSLISIESKHVACKYQEEWLSCPKDPIVYARKLVIGGIRPWSNYSFFTGLSENRTHGERREIVDEFFESFVNEVSKAPSAYALSHIHAHILFEKKLH